MTMPPYANEATVSQRRCSTTEPAKSKTPPKRTSREGQLKPNEKLSLGQTIPKQNETHARRVAPASHAERQYPPPPEPP